MGNLNINNLTLPHYFFSGFWPKSLEYEGVINIAYVEKVIHDVAVCGTGNPSDLESFSVARMREDIYKP